MKFDHSRWLLWLLRWPRLFGLCIAVVIALIVSWLFHFSFWLALPLAVVAMIANGIFAEWEDNQPGGFNNPDGKG